MPLQPAHKTFINNALEFLFPTPAALCQRIVQEAFTLAPSAVTRARQTDEPEDHYTLFACIAYPEMQFKRLEKHHADPITVTEVQTYVLLYLVARLTFQHHHDSENFDIETWLPQLIQPTTNATECKDDKTGNTPLPSTSATAWLEHPILQQRVLADLQWDLTKTLEQLQTLAASRPDTSFQTYSPANQHSGDYGWDLTCDPLRNYTAEITEREAKEDETGPQLDLTITVNLPTNKMTIIKSAFMPYPETEERRERIKFLAITAAAYKSRKNTFDYLNRHTRSGLVFDPTRPGLWLLRYRHYIEAVMSQKLTLGFFFTLSIDDRIKLSLPAIITFHREQLATIETLRTLPTHTMRLLETDIYYQRARESDLAFALLQTYSPERCQILLQPAIVNLQKAGQLSLALAAEISADTAAIFANEFYYEAIRDNKVAADYYHPMTPEHKNVALNPHVIALIQQGRIGIEKTHNLTAAMIRLINHPFYFHLLLHGHLDSEAGLQYLDDRTIDTLSLPVIIKLQELKLLTFTEVSELTQSKSGEGARALFEMPAEWTPAAIAEVYYKIALLNLHASLKTTCELNSDLQEIPLIRLLQTWIKQTMAQHVAKPDDPLLWTNTFNYLAKMTFKQPDISGITFFGHRKKEKLQALQQQFTAVSEGLAKLLENFNSTVVENADNPATSLRFS